MPTICTYRTPTEPHCPDAATTTVLGSGLAADWHVGWVSGMTRMFCDRHAALVAERRNTQHLEAQEARVLRPTTKTRLACAVCGDKLDGVGIQIPEVPEGPVCDACHRAANDAQLDDPRTHPVRKRPRRRKETVHATL